MEESTHSISETRGPEHAACTQFDMMMRASVWHVFGGEFEACFREVLVVSAPDDHDRPEGPPRPMPENVHANGDVVLEASGVPLKELVAICGDQFRPRAFGDLHLWLEDHNDAERRWQTLSNRLNKTLAVYAWQPDRSRVSLVPTVGCTIATPPATEYRHVATYRPIASA